MRGDRKCLEVAKKIYCGGQRLIQTAALQTKYARTTSPQCQTSQFFGREKWTVVKYLYHNAADFYSLLHFRFLLLTIEGCVGDGEGKVCMKWAYYQRFSSAPCKVRSRSSRGASRGAVVEVVQSSRQALAYLEKAESKSKLCKQHRAALSGGDTRSYFHHLSAMHTSRKFPVVSRSE